MLGCLIEKQRTTPDAYPLSLNALRLACNQSTNRDPVVDYDEATIRDALHRLARRRWTRLASGPAAARPSTATCSTRRSALDARRAGAARGADAARPADAGRAASSAPSACTVRRPRRASRRRSTRLIERELVAAARAPAGPEGGALRAPAGGRGRGRGRTPAPAPAPVAWRVLRRPPPRPPSPTRSSGAWTRSRPSGRAPRGAGRAARSSWAAEPPRVCPHHAGPGG